MDRLFDYFTNHPFLAGGAVLMVIVVLAYEIRQRSLGAGAVSPAQAIRMMNDGAVVVDVRAAGRYKDGHIQGARNVPGDQLAEGTLPLEKLADKALIVCCDDGATSASAARTLARAGFSSVFTLRGGLTAWRHENLPVAKG